MAEEWFSYADLGERLGVTPEAARQKAIRARWPRRTANDGKAQVRVDVEDVRATMPVRRPKDDEPDEGPTPVEPALDGQTLAAMEAHIATLREMVTRADDLVGIERERASDARSRADAERERADHERQRADGLSARIEAMHQVEGADRIELERRIAELNATVETMKRPQAWWKRIAG